MKRGVAALTVLGIALAAGCVAERTHGHGHLAITTERAPKPVGPYAQAVLAGDTLYLAGQIGLDPASGALVAGGIEPETRRALDNLFAVLDAAGFTPAEVVQAQVYLTDLADFAAMNTVYAERFQGGAPARATVQVAALPKGAHVEIVLVAVRL